MGARPLRVWIDATDAAASARVIFGITLLERHLHALLEAGLQPNEVRIELPPGAPHPPLPRSLTERLPLRTIGSADPPGERLGRALRDAGSDPVLALEADTIVDSRLFSFLAGRTGSLAALGGDGGQRVAVLRLEGELPAGIDPNARLPERADAALDRGAVKPVNLGDMVEYLKRLRRHLPAYLFRIRDSNDAARAERFLFESNYKGSTDVFTKYVYPPLVWQALKPLTRWRVNPNWVSAFNVLITFLAIPLFMAGSWVPGLILAYLMSVIDSVDGKLARLTYTSSKLGHVLDHGLDVVHPPMWYAAWAWALSGGNPEAPVFQASLWMAGLYFFDRILIQCFTWRTDRSIHAYAPLDVRMRTFISRRNINVPIFTVGLIFGAPVFAFGVVVAWQVATAVFHFARLVQVWKDPSQPERSTIP